MKKNDKKEVLSKDPAELRKTLAEKKGQLFQLILDNNQFKLKNNRQIFHIRKDIARIKTAIREKELSQKKG